MTQYPLNWQKIREKLAQSQGPAYWRSLAELAETAEFTDWVAREFPGGTAVWPNGLSRRRFLQLMAASLGLAGLTACVGSPPESIVPYVTQPESIIPGKPLYFATAHVLNGYAQGILVESHMGRPTKIEGNPDHSASLGATDLFAQASILTLYDPDRSQTVVSDGRIRTWNEFDEALTLSLGQQQASRGAGFRILTPTITSPTLAAQLADVQARFPQALWHQYEPINQDAAYEGTRLAFGNTLAARYRLQQADVILALGADFLFTTPGHVAYSHDYSARRQVRQEQATMNRLYVVESTPSLTGAMADHRWPLRPAEIENFARHVAVALGLAVASGPELSEAWMQRVTAVADDLRQHAGQCLVMAGEEQSTAVQALAHAMNAELNNAGQTVVYTAPVSANVANQTDSLRRLVSDMRAGAVDLLLILESNPVYNAPVDLGFAEALTTVPLSVHLGLYEDETAGRCTWHLPQAHYLESWSDTRAYDGTVTIRQPLIAPLYNGRSAHELLAIILGQPGRTSLDVVSGYWQELVTGSTADVDQIFNEGVPALSRADSDGETEQSSQATAGSEQNNPEQAAFAAWWQLSLRLGLVANTQLNPVEVSLATLDLPAPPVAEAEILQLIFRPDYTMWDGRYSNNAWLQETPSPFTKITWDNAALISPGTAERLGLQNEEIVALTVDGRTVNAPVWILSGQADDCVTVHLGYGRSQAGRVGQGIGFNAYALRTAAAPWFTTGLGLEKTGDAASLATTQNHHLMEGRDVVHITTLAEFQQERDQEHEAEQPSSLYPEYSYEGNAWGMVIDLNTCIGCNACTVACQAENNIPVVGKEGVANGREMHWIRVDGYFQGDLDNPALLHQPVPCMHCEKAPCEPVCPVAATTHSHEGLNEMTYNRCVGTRYCSNNCPYKVRRFNFFDYSGEAPILLEMARNPDVTVRARGVMEKCTYCVQRINQARISAKKENRPIRDGDVQTACQQVCPAQAIIFGNINDETAEVTRLKAQPHNYSLLEELNTQPRTTYLARLRNANSALDKEI